MRVVLATDEPELRAALLVFLAERRVDVVGVVDEPCGLASEVASACPDVVIVDSRFDGALSDGVVHDLQTGNDPVPVVVLATSADRLKAEASGARGMAMLGDPPDSLVVALRRVLTG